MTVGHVEAQRLAFEARTLMSTTTVRRAMVRPADGVVHPLAGLRAANVVRPGQTIQDAVDAVAEWMLTNYRSEIVYKNAIANRIFLKRYGWKNASMLTEFRVGESIADCVVVNGHGSVFEVKTELDNAGKLRKQIADYHKAFRAVTLVTHRSLASHYIDALGQLPVGLMTLDDGGRLRTVRQASPECELLSVGVMMRSLRKSEYTRIAEAISGRVIDVPSVRHFSECLKVAQSVSSLEYSRLFEDQLRNRRLRSAAVVTSKRFSHLRGQLLKVDPSTVQLGRLDEWLSRKV